MRIALVAVGTQGDIQPALILGRGLQEAGHTVRFVCAGYYHALTRESGLEPMDLESPDPRETMAAVQSTTVSTSPLQRYLRMLRPTGAPAAAQRRRMVECCRNVDLILGNYPVVRHVAESLGTQYIGFGVTPVHATREFPHPLSRMKGRGDSWINLMTHRAIQRVFLRREHGWVNEWRKEIGLATRSISQLAADFQQAPFLYGISPTVLRRPADWPSQVRMTGYWFPGEGATWDANSKLVDFLRAGSPPVAVGFGSLVDPDPENFRCLLVSALRKADVRAIVLGGWSHGSEAAGDSQFFFADWIPFPWLLSRVSALVHHAGSGTCALAVRAGVPSVCVPYSGEQAFWARRLEALHASSGSIPRRTVTDTALARLLKCLKDDSRYKKSTSELSSRLATEHGTATAVAAVEEFSRTAG